MATIPVLRGLRRQLRAREPRRAPGRSRRRWKWRETPRARSLRGKSLPGSVRQSCSSSDQMRASERPRPAPTKLPRLRTVRGTSMDSKA
ncbi:unnamed protein product [Symbiodinium microadriaticum]|nr:unnamed protein product [Symbiodinium microadriaticum]CAE7838532.1 unnamed protein product [Symbiodinium sp. KB8]